jgi:FkbM family methyltransferase
MMTKRTELAEDRIELSNRCLYRIFRFFSRIPVLKRVYPSLQKRWAAITWTGGYKVKRYNGLLLLLNYKNLVDRKVGLHGGYELEQFSYFFSQLKQKEGSDIFLDVGANIGLYALHAAHLGVQEIHAFEPDPRNYAQFMGNLYLNELTGAIQAHQYALSDKSGLLEFDLPPDTKTNLTKVATVATSSTQKLPVKPLDAVLSCSGKTIFFKIDVEGHEHAVLKGATQLLRNNDCFLQVEAWPENVAAITKDLETLGYKQIHRIQNDYYFERITSH